PDLIGLAHGAATERNPGAAVGRPGLRQGDYLLAGRIRQDSPDVGHSRTSRLARGLAALQDGAPGNRVGATVSAPSAPQASPRAGDTTSSRLLAQGGVP